MNDQSNYFELLGVPQSFTTDRSLLRKNYMEQSRRYHPDYFVNSESTLQENALQISALLNRAYKTLNNREATIAYLLQLKGLLTEGEKYVLPPEFLMEMMELNEELAEAALEGAGEGGVKQKLQEVEKRIYDPVEKIIEDYREGVTSEKELLQVKDYFYKKKYLERLSGQLGGMS